MELINRVSQNMLLTECCWTHGAQLAVVGTHSYWYSNLNQTWTRNCFLGVSYEDWAFCEQVEVSTMAQNNMGLDVAAWCSSLLPSSPPSSPSSSAGQATRRVPRFSARAAPSRRARTNSNWTGSRWDTKVLFPERGWRAASIAFGN